MKSSVAEKTVEGKSLAAARADHAIILDMVRPNSRVLDLGCGDGELLSLLQTVKKCVVRGIEKNEQAIYRCVERGLSVLHDDIDTGLPDYGDKSFDYVILNQTLQEVKNPDAVLAEALRVGSEVIVAFPNFAHYSARMQIFFGGKVPVTRSLPYEWYNTPNLHFLSILDFKEYCRVRGIRIEQSAYVGAHGRVRLFPDLRALVGIFLTTRDEGR